jgi:glycosyltransferase involved in cell wall biosynthesis
MQARKRPVRPPKVSVCIVGNRTARHLQKTINSVLTRRFDDLDIVTADNESSYAAAHFGAEADGSVRVIRNETTVPLTADFNMAVRHRRGQFVKLLCLDGLLQPDCIAVQAKVLGDEDLREWSDMELRMRQLRLGKFFGMPETLASVRESHGSMSASASLLLQLAERIEFARPLINDPVWVSAADRMVGYVKCCVSSLRGHRYRLRDQPLKNLKALDVIHRWRSRWPAPDSAGPIGHTRLDRPLAGGPQRGKSINLSTGGRRPRPRSGAFVTDFPLFGSDLECESTTLEGN